MSNIWADVIFSDDIRVEEGNKALLLGVYGTDIVIEQPDQRSLALSVTVQIFGPSQTVLKSMGTKFYLERELVESYDYDENYLLDIRDEFKIQAEMFSVLEDSYGPISDALLAFTTLPISITINKSLSILNATVDVGFGSMAAGSVAVKRGIVKFPSQELLQKSTAANTLPTPG